MDVSVKLATLICTHRLRTNPILTLLLFILRPTFILFKKLKGIILTAQRFIYFFFPASFLELMKAIQQNCSKIN